MQTAVDSPALPERRLEPCLFVQNGPVLARSRSHGPQEKLFVYVLRSDVKPERHYVGLTADTAERIAAHNVGQSVHTASDRPWSLVVSMEFRDEQVARRFEHYLKSGSGRVFAKRHFADGPPSDDAM